MTDPRPDLKGDSKEWDKLLGLVTDEMVTGVLHGFRCGGLRLQRGKKGWALRPDLDPATCMWTTKEAYLADRDEWLVPYQAEIVSLLKLL